MSRGLSYAGDADARLIFAGADDDDEWDDGLGSYADVDGGGLPRHDRAAGWASAAKTTHAGGTHGAHLATAPHGDGAARGNLRDDDDDRHVSSGGRPAAGDVSSGWAAAALDRSLDADARLRAPNEALQDDGLPPMSPPAPASHAVGIETERPPPAKASVGGSPPPSYLAAYEEDIPSSAAEMALSVSVDGRRGGGGSDADADDDHQPPPPLPPEPTRYDGEEVVSAIRRAFLAEIPPQHPPRTLWYAREVTDWRREAARFGEMPGLLNALRDALEEAAAAAPGKKEAFERAAAEATIPAVLIWGVLDSYEVRRVSERCPYEPRVDDGFPVVCFDIVHFADGGRARRVRWICGGVLRSLEPPTDGTWRSVRCCAARRPWLEESWQYEEEFLDLDGVDPLLRALALFCLHPHVVGALLTLALKSPAGRGELDALDAVRAIRAAMVAQPQLDYGGAFRDMRPWLDEGGTDADGSERLIAQRVTAARAAATSEKTKTSDENGAGDITPRTPRQTGGGSTASSPKKSPPPSKSVLDFLQSERPDGYVMKGPEVADLTGLGGAWFAFQQHQDALLVPTVARKIRRLTFNPAAVMMHGHVQPAHFWVTEDYAALCYVYGAKLADGTLPKGERRMALRDLIEVRRGISTKSLLQYAPKGSANRCLAIRFTSKTLNVVFETPAEMETWASALGALGAHVTSLIGANGVNAQARQAFAESLVGIVGGEDAFPRPVAAAEFELDKALARGICGCSPQCAGRFCRQQLKQVEKVASERRTTTSKITLNRILEAEKKREERLLADLMKFRTARDQEGMRLAKVAANWRAKAAASRASDAENEVTIELEATQKRVDVIRSRINAATQSLRFAGLLANVGATRGKARKEGDVLLGELGDDDSLVSDMSYAEAHRIVAAVESDDYVVALAALREMAAKTENKKATQPRRALGAEGAVSAVVELLGAPADDGGKVAAAAARCCAHLARDKPAAANMLKMGALPVLLSRLRDIASAAAEDEARLASDAAQKAKTAERARLNAANVGIDDDDADDSPGTNRLYSTRDAMAAAEAADAAGVLARSPATPPVGTFETCSLVVNLCAGAEGLAARVEAVTSGAMLDLTRLLACLCRNGGAPGPDDEGRDVVKPVCMLLRSLSLDADPELMAGGVETVRGLVKLGEQSDIPEAVLTPIVWTVSNLARTGPVWQNHLRDLGVLPWLMRVVQKSRPVSSRMGLDEDDSDEGGDAKVETAAVLAAITNLASGNSAIQSRLRAEEGLMEALQALVDDAAADGLARKSAQRALVALGSVLNHAQAQQLAKLRTLVEGYPPEVQVATWARLEGRMWVARKL